MAKYVPDILSKRWVIISSQRSSRPDENNHKEQPHICPFCEGNESHTTPEVFRIGNGEANEQGWDVRVIPNKYPITDFHEVIIHSPDHTKDFADFSLKQISNVFTAYRERFNFYRDKGQVMIFCNKGEGSGASIKHSHSQLVVIPFQINLDTLTQEPLNNIVDENNFFHIYCPDFSQWPYEVWVTPKKEGTMYGDITDEEIADLAEVFQGILHKLEKVSTVTKLGAEEFSYNFYIHPKENWYMRIIPRFVHRAGFELGTGLSVNIVDPSVAAMELGGVEPEMIGVMERLKALKGT